MRNVVAVNCSRSAAPCSVRPASSLCAATAAATTTATITAPTIAARVPRERRDVAIAAMAAADVRPTLPNALRDSENQRPIAIVKAAPIHGSRPAPRARSAMPAVRHKTIAK